MTTTRIGANLQDPVAKHMRRDFSFVRDDQTVAEALASVRERQPGGRIVYFYVVDGDGRLCGVVPTRRLMLSPPEAPVTRIMVRQVIALPETATVLDACEFFTLHRLLAFPVVDAERRIVGVVDVELYTDELSTIETYESNEDLFQLIGVHLTEAQQASPVASFRGRFPWLLCNIAGGILAAFLTGLFEAELQKAVALALFIPVALALAESVGIQSVSLALEVMRGKPPTWAALLGKLRVEAVTGLLLGGASALLVGLFALAWQRQLSVAACLLGGIGGGVAGAAVLGLALPYTLRLLKRNPQVAAGPIALAGADMLTLLLYFNLARWWQG
jgi:magnesium transporter